MRCIWPGSAATLLRRAGVAVRRGRGDSTVPAALRAHGVTSREVDVLVPADPRSDQSWRSPNSSSSPHARWRPTSPICWPSRAPRTGSSSGLGGLLNSVVDPDLRRRRDAQSGGHRVGTGAHARGMIMSTSYDVVIAGAGPSGLTTAVSLARAGVRVLVVEKHSGAVGFSRRPPACGRGPWRSCGVGGWSRRCWTGRSRPSWRWPSGRCWPRRETRSRWVCRPRRC